MGSRTIQLALIVALGVAIGLALTRPWQGSRDGEKDALSVHVPEPPAPAPDMKGSAAAAAKPAASAAPVDASSSSPARTFNLPQMSAPGPGAPARTQEPPTQRPARPRTVLVPKDWLLRGSGPQNYDVRIDHDDVFSGQSSVLFASYDKDVAYTQFGSLMQTVVGEPWAGKRVEFSMSTRDDGRSGQGTLWIRAIDAASVVIAYDESDVPYDRLEWKKSTAVIDVPWSAAEIAYGINLEGSGKIHLDDAHLKALDKSVAAPPRNLPERLGGKAQTADQKGPLAKPANLDFEIAVRAEESFREVPKDKVDRRRF